MAKVKATIKQTEPKSDIEIGWDEMDAWFDQKIQEFEKEVEDTVDEKAFDDLDAKVDAFEERYNTFKKGGTTFNNKKDALKAAIRETTPTLLQILIPLLVTVNGFAIAIGAALGATIASNLGITFAMALLACMDCFEKYLDNIANSGL